MTLSAYTPRLDALAHHFEHLILPGASQAIVGKDQPKPGIGSTRLPLEIVTRGIQPSAVMNFPKIFNPERYGLNGRRGSRISPDEARNELRRILKIKVPRDKDAIAVLLEEMGFPDKAMDIARRGRLID